MSDRAASILCYSAHSQPARQLEPLEFGFGQDVHKE